MDTDVVVKFGGDASGLQAAASAAAASLAGVVDGQSALAAAAREATADIERMRSALTVAAADAAAGEAVRLDAARQTAATGGRLEQEGAAVSEQAQRRVVAAARQGADDAVRAKIAGLRLQQAADADNRDKVLAEEEEILAALRAGGAQATAAYEAELLRRARLKRQADDRELSAQLADWRAMLAQDKGGLAERQDLLDQFHAWSATALADSVELSHRAGELERQQTQRLAEEGRRERERALDEEGRQTQEVGAQRVRAIADEAALGAISRQEASRQTLSAILEERQAEQALLAQKLEIDGLTLEERRRVLDQQAALEARYAAAVVAQARGAAQDASNAWEQALHPLDRAVDQSVGGIIQGNQTASQAAARAASSILASYAGSAAQSATAWLKNQILMTQGTEAQTRARALIQSLSTAQDQQAVQTAVNAYVAGQTAQTTAAGGGAAQRSAVGATENGGFFARIGARVSSWFGGEEAQTAATAAGTAERGAVEATAAATSAAVTATTTGASITAKAADAAAGAYEAVSGIPIVGPVLAPVAAAGAFTAVLAYKAIASAEGGWGEVPYDGAPAILHKQEMVLPASIATPLRQMVAQKVPQFGLPPLGSSMLAAPTAAASGAGATTTHNHNYAINVSALDAKSFQSFIKSGGGDVIVQHIQNKRRNFGV